LLATLLVNVVTPLVNTGLLHVGVIGHWLVGWLPVITPSVGHVGYVYTPRHTPLVVGCWLLAIGIATLVAAGYNVVGYRLEEHYCRIAGHHCHILAGIG